LRLARLDISRFRRIRDQSIDWHPVTVLFGPNDSGKTSLLDAIEETLASVGGDEDKNIDADVTVELDGLADDGIDAALWHQLQVESAFWIHPSRRLAGDRSAADWFFMSEDPLFFPIGDLDGTASNGGELAEQICAELESLTDDPEVLCAARLVVETALAPPPGIRISTGADWQWAPNLRPLGQDVMTAMETLGAAIPPLRRNLDRKRKSLRPTELARTDPAREALLSVTGALSSLRGGHECPEPFDVHHQSGVLAAWRVVRIGDAHAGRAQAEQHLAEAIDWFVRLTNRDRPSPESDAWLEEEDDGSIRLHEHVEFLCRGLGLLAKEIAPGFVTREYRIGARPISPARWRSGEIASRVAVTLTLDAEGVDDSEAAATALRLDQVGSGIGVWAAYAVVEAVRQMRLNFERTMKERQEQPTPEAIVMELLGTDYPDPNSRDYKRIYHLAETFPLIPDSWLHTVYLIDEPERHLHPVAQDDARRWIARLVEEGDCSVVVATHSLEFLDVPTRLAQYVRVAPDADRTTTLTPITDDIVGALQSEAETLGIQPTQLIHLTRLWLMVEGEHDAMILRHFYGAELRRHRVSLFVLRGAKNALAVAQLEHLASYGAPIAAVFDDPLGAMANGELSERRSQTHEDRIIAGLRHLRDAANENAPLDLTIHRLPYPDVFCVLPEDAIQATLENDYRGRSVRFPGWDAVLAKYHEQAGGENAKDLKRVLFREIQLNTDSTEFLSAVLKRCPSAPLPDSPLDDLVAAILARAGEERPPRVASP